MRKYRTLKVLLENEMCPLSNEELNNWAHYKKGEDFKYPQSKNFIEWLSLEPYELRAKAADPNNNLSKYEIGRALYHICQRRGYYSNRKDQKQDERTNTDKAIKELKNKIGDLTLGQYFSTLDPHQQRIRTTITGRKLLQDEFEQICKAQNLSEDLSKKIYREVFFQRPLKSQKHNIGKCPFEKNKYRCHISHPLFELFRMYSFINTIKYKVANDTEGEFEHLQGEIRDNVIKLFFRKKPHFDFLDIIKEIEKNHNPKWKEKDYPRYYTYNYIPKTNVAGCPTIAEFKALFGDNWLNFKIDREDFKVDIFEIWNVLNNYEDDDKLYEYAINRLDFDEEKANKFTKINLKEGYGSLSLKAIKKILPYLEKGLLYSHSVFLANMPEVIGKAKWEKLKEQISDEIEFIIESHTDQKKKVLIVNTVLNRIRNSEKHININYCLKNKDKEALITATENEYGRKRYASMIENDREKLLIDLEHSLMEQIAKKPNGEYLQNKRIDEMVIEYLSEAQYNIPKENFDKLYHPSEIEIFPKAKPTNINGKNYYLLGSPSTPSVRNPMAMRALYELKSLINELILSDRLDPQNDTVIIETTRDLNNANERKAIQKYQNELEKRRQKYKTEISELYFEEYKKEYIPNDRDILKFQLWIEQNKKCIYTGQTIPLHSFLGENPDFDIEHTLPRSQSFDNSQENITLANNYYNRFIKKNLLPVNLPNYNEEVTISLGGKSIICPPIVETIKIWLEKAIEFENRKEIANGRSKMATTKDQKDDAIIDRHYNLIHRNYWKGKFNRFMMNEIKEGFKNSQLIDTGIITKYSIHYLKTVFDKVIAVKGNITADLRKLWGLQNIIEQDTDTEDDALSTINPTGKDRSEHSHHAIDAIVISLMDRRNTIDNKTIYETLAKYFREKEDEFINNSLRPYFPRPWKNFVEDVLKIKENILISYSFRDSTLKQTKRKLKINNNIQYTDQLDENGKKIPKYEKGLGIRASLNKETFYGVIKRNQVNTKSGEIEEVIKYTKTIPVQNLKESDIKFIVDDKIRNMFENQVLSKIKENGIFLEPNLKKNPEGKPVPIKNIKVFANKLSPVIFKPHTHLSKKDYKNNYIVENDGNYAIAIYKGLDSKNENITECKLISNLELSNQLRSGSVQNLFPTEITITDKKNNIITLPFFCRLKAGDLVVMYNESPDELPYYQALINNEQINIRELPEEIRKELKLRIFRLIKFFIPNNLILGRHFYSNINADKDTSVKDVTKIDGKVKRCNSNTFKGIPIVLDVTGTFIKISKYYND